MVVHKSPPFLTVWCWACVFEYNVLYWKVGEIAEVV